MLAGTNVAATSTSRSAAASSLVHRLGFKSISCIRLPDDPRSTVAVIEGIVHRHPCTARVPLRLAMRLVDGGIPVLPTRETRPDRAGAEGR